LTDECFIQTVITTIIFTVIIIVTTIIVIVIIISRALTLHSNAVRYNHHSVLGSSLPAW
jgi:hypothetical protein